MKTLIAALTFALVAAAAAAATPDALFQSGRQALSNGEPEKAVGLFEQAIKLRPNESEYHFFAGTAYGRLAQKSNILKAASLAKKSLAAMEKAVALDPNNLDARFGLISYYKIAPGFMGGDDEKALKQAIEIRKRDPLLGHRALAVIHTADKKPELARKEYLDAIRENPAEPKAHHYFGMYLTNQKQFDEAAKHFETALSMNPPFMPSHFRLGVVSMLSKANYPRGEAELKKYLTHTPAEDEPTHADAWYMLGQLYEQQGRKEDAKQCYSNVLRLQPGSKAAADALKRVS